MGWMTIPHRPWQQALALSSAKKTEKALGPKVKKAEAALAEAESGLKEAGHLLQLCQSLQSLAVRSLPKNAGGSKVDRRVQAAH